MNTQGITDFKKYNFKTTYCVELSDYRNIYVESDYIEVTDADVITSIEMDSMNEVYEYVRNKTKTNIIFTYMMDKILDDTIILYLPQPIKSKYDNKNASFWNEIIIYKAILEYEKYEVTRREFEKAIEDAASNSNLSIDNVIDEYLDSVLHFTLEQKLKKILVNYIHIV